VHVFAWEQNREIAVLDAHTTHSPNLDRTLRTLVVAASGSHLETETAEQTMLNRFSDAAVDAASGRIGLAHDGEIDIADLASGKILDTIPVPNSTIRACAFASSDSLLVGVLSELGFRYDLSTHTQHV
jgi:hypothetical protein